MPLSYDAIIIGSGSNGISAAIYLQQKGLKTAIFEQASTPGGSTRTQELTLPGFKHDVGSAVLPMGFGSPFLRSLPLSDHGLEWIFPEIPYSHPFNDGTAHACYTDIEKTAAQLVDDEASYIKLFEPLVKNWGKIENDLLGPLGIPEHPLDFIKFGMKALPSAKMLAKHYFKNEKSRIFFYGSAAHSTLPLDSMASASFGIVLSTMAHKYNWPFPKGGAQNFINSMLSYYTSIGGELHLERNIAHLEELPGSKTYLFDLTPKQLLKIKGTDFSGLYRKRMSSFKYGAGVFKIDWALSKPIPFTSEKCRKSGTVHIGFSEEEMEKSEKGIHHKQMTDKPYVLVAQHSIFDNTRAPEGKHTAWAYCHVPNGSIADFSAIIEDQIERAAPGFKQCILKKHTMNSVQLEAFNPNIIGGDINGGKQDITQLFTRPIAKSTPYATPDPRIYICSSSTPPGGGVHGMCGFNAARAVVKDHF